MTKSALPESSLSLLREIAAVMVDDGNGVPAGRLDWAMTELGQFAVASGPRTRFGLRACAGVIQWFGPLLVLGRARRFTGLEPAARSHCLEKMEGGPLTLLLVPVKAVVCMHYFEHPEVLAGLGYDGRPLVEMPMTVGVVSEVPR